LKAHCMNSVNILGNRRRAMNIGRRKGEGDRNDPLQLGGNHQLETFNVFGVPVSSPRRDRVGRKSEYKLWTIS
jgi:hypothetical protein